MASIHIREKDPKNKTVNCIFHILVPATQNAVGVNWKYVVQKALTPDPLMSDNDSTENASISAGDIYEVAETVRFSSLTLTNAERLAEVETWYNAKKDTIFQQLKNRLDYFGKEVI